MAKSELGGDEPLLSLSPCNIVILLGWVARADVDGATAKCILRVKHKGVLFDGLVGSECKLLSLRDVQRSFVVAKSLLLQLRSAGLSVKLSVLLGRDGEVDRMKEMRKQREEINDKNSNYACACSYSQTCPVSIKAQTS